MTVVRVLDPGHRYALSHLDGHRETMLQFVKREGPKYPGNVGRYEGTTMQEVLRALIDRADYVNDQMAADETVRAHAHLLEALYLFEVRAARMQGRPVTFDAWEALRGAVCSECGHVGCKGECA